MWSIRHKSSTAHPVSSTSSSAKAIAQMDRPVGSGTTFLRQRPEELVTQDAEVIQKDRISLSDSLRGPEWHRLPCITRKLNAVCSRDNPAVLECYAAVGGSRFSNVITWRNLYMRVPAPEYSIVENGFRPLRFAAIRTDGSIHRSLCQNLEWKSC